MIKANDTVTIAFKLKDESGKVWDEHTVDAPFTYTHGQQQMMHFIEDALTGKKQGDTVIIHIPPEKGYGSRDEKLIQSLPKEHFKDIKNLSVGMQFNPSLDSNISFVVTHIDEESVTVDANHPLADLTLIFEIEILDVKPA